LFGPLRVSLCYTLGLMYLQLRYGIAICLLVVLLSPPSFSQQQNADNPNQYFAVGLKTGSFLPYGIEGVRELLPMWGLRLGHSLSRTFSMEYNLDMANAKGVNYNLAYLSFRTDFNIGQVLPLFVIAGVDAHYYKRRDSYGSITGRLTEYDYQFSTGWHLGFGNETLIFGDLYLRSDVRMGFSPGRQLSVALGMMYRF
jgi:hypothetical protein